MGVWRTKHAIDWEDWFWFLLSAGCLSGFVAIGREMDGVWFIPPCILAMFVGLGLLSLLTGCVAVKDGLERGFHWMRLVTFILTIPAWAYAGLVSVHMVVR